MKLCSVGVWTVCGLTRGQSALRPLTAQDLVFWLIEFLPC